MFSNRWRVSNVARVLVVVEVCGIIGFSSSKCLSVALQMQLLLKAETRYFSPRTTVADRL